MVLAEVFTSALEETETRSDMPTISESQTQISKVSTGVTNTATTPASQSLDLVVKFQVDDPEIVLLADGKEKNTDALILNVSRTKIRKVD